MRYFLLLSIALAGYMAASIQGQEQPFSLRVDVPFVSVDVSVHDTTGTPLASLEQKDFTLYEDGKPQKMVSFSAVAAPYGILLLFDRSASATGQRSFMKSAIDNFLQGLRPQDQAAVASFDDTFRIAAAWGSNSAKVSGAVDEVFQEMTSGETRFYEALERATTREFTRTSGRRALVVLTDGRDSAFYKDTVRKEHPPQAESDLLFQRTLAQLRKARVPVYFVAMNTDKNLSKSPGGDLLNLQRVFAGSGLAEAFLAETRHRLELIAEATGGRVSVPATLEDVASAYTKIRSDLTGSYSLGYVAGPSGGRNETRKIEVRVNRPGVVVRQSRDSYNAP